MKISTTAVPALIVALLAALISACGSAASPPPAQYGVTIGEGIAGVKLGMKPSEVRQVLGKPDRIKRPSGTAQPQFTYYTYKRRQLTIGMTSDVTSISTTDPKERTAGGLGVGSTRAQVKQGLPGIRCGRGRSAGCLLQSPNHANTRFAMSRSGVVTGVGVFYVIA